jgi:three-Cys-motif partner protein
VPECQGCDRRRFVTEDGLCGVRNADDGLPVRCTGDWSQEKLLYLRRYIFMFARATKYKWTGNRWYVDLFAGPGKGRDRETGEFYDGSPLLAAGVDDPFDGYVFVDSSPVVTAALTQRVSLPSGVQPHIVPLDCNRAVDRLLGLIPPRALCLTFVDPTGLHIRFETLSDFVEKRRSDLIVNFPYYTAIRRNIDRWLAKDECPLDEFMPDRSWRTSVKRARREGRPAVLALLEGYQSGLEALGYQYFIPQVRILTSRNLPLYVLLYATKHKLGKQFWNEAVDRHPSGQMRIPFNQG